MAYTSIVDLLKAKGQASDYNSRAALAKQYGITNYSGTAEQNTALLGKLQTPAPATQTPAATPQKTMGEYGNVGSAFSATKQNSTNYSAPAPKTPTAAAPANYAQPKPTEVQSQISGISSRITELKSQLDTAKEAGYTGDYFGNKEIKYDGSGKIIKANDAYSDYSSYEKARNEHQSGLDKIISDLDEAKAKQKEVYASLATKQTELFNQTYAALGLDEKKNKIAEYDSAITAKTAERDKLLLDEQGKPIAKWLLTGDLQLIADKANNEINQLVEQRDNAAGDYNLGVDELETRVEAGMADAKTQADYFNTLVVNLSNQAMSHQSQLVSLLNGEKSMNTPHSEIIEASGRKMLVTYNAQGKVIASEDLGEATKASASGGSVNNPSSYDEYQLAKNDPEYANFIATSKGKSDGKETDDEKLGKLNDVKTAIDNVKTSMNAKTWGVDPFGATSGINKIPGTAGYDFQNKVNNLVSLLTLENMGIMKGVLSDSDMKVIKSASARIDTGLSKDEFSKAITEIETKITTAINKLNSSSKPSGSSGGTSGDAADSLRSKYNY